MNNFKRFSGILLYSVFVVFLILRGETYGRVFRERMQWDLNFLPIISFSMAFPLIIGLVLAFAAPVR